MDGLDSELIKIAKEYFIKVLKFIIVSLPCCFLPLYLWLAFRFHQNQTNFIWFLLLAYFFVIFLISAWLVFDIEYEDLENNRSPKVYLNREPSNSALIARYEHIGSEITRYRDLGWKIGGYAWGIYFALYQLKSNHGQEIISLSDDLWVGLFYWTAIFVTIFLLFCEHTAQRNRNQRILLEERIELDFRFRHRSHSERLTRLGFLVSLSIFLLVIWGPPVVILFNLSPSCYFNY